MKVAGIICECNPLHAGHLRVIEAARAAGADAVIGVMSSYFVQRGEPAVMEPYARAEVLIKTGFDAVFALPFPYASAGAEIFGRAGVELLARLGADEIWFGSECGDMDTLKACAEIAESEAFRLAYAQKQTENASLGTAKRYFDLLASHAADAGLTLYSNDILALSYLRAIRRLGARITPHTISREGASYREEALTDAVLPSATALRRAWKEEGINRILTCIPKPCAEMLSEESDKGHAPADLGRASRAILARLRLASSGELEEVAELGGGLGERLAAAAWEVSDLDALMARVATKKYPDARIRRGLLFGMLGITWEDLRSPIAYARLLAANSVGCTFLSSIRKTAEIPVVTRQSDLPHTREAARQSELEARAAALYALMLPTPLSPYELIARSARIVGAPNEKNSKK